MKKRLCFMFVLLSVLLFSGHAYSWTPTQEDQKKLDSNYDCKQKLKTDIESIVSNGENANLKKINPNDISQIKKIYKNQFKEDLATYPTSAGETHEPGHIDDFIKILSETYCTEVDQDVIENANTETNEQASTAPAEQPAPAEESGVRESSNTEESSEPAVPTLQNETQEKSFHKRFRNVCKTLQLKINSDANYDSDKDTCEIKPAEDSISLSDIKSIIPSVISGFKAKNIICQQVKYQQYKKIWFTTCEDNTTSENATATRGIIFDYSNIKITCKNEKDYMFDSKTGECTKIEEDDGELSESAGEEAGHDASSAPEEAPEEAPTDAKSEPQENAALPISEDEGKTAEAGTQPKIKDNLIEQLRKDAEQIVNAYTTTKTQIEAKLETSNQ